jgi:hypothetical protein
MVPNYHTSRPYNIAVALLKLSGKQWKCFCILSSGRDISPLVATNFKDIAA